MHSKGQIISEWNFGAFIFQNTNKTIWQTSALEPKSGQIKKNKGIYYIKYPIMNVMKCIYFIDLTTLWELGQEFVKFVVGKEFYSEIKRTLGIAK